jgi:hypothetical protein
MEYFPYGDLDKYITEDITENDVIQITTNLLEGLKIMHAEGFAHRDLKPQVGFPISPVPAHVLKFFEDRGSFVVSSLMGYIEYFCCRETPKRAKVVGQNRRLRHQQADYKRSNGSSDHGRHSPLPSPRDWRFRGMRRKLRI